MYSWVNSMVNVLLGPETVCKLVRYKTFNFKDLKICG
jgi:hypothetical protein